MTDQEKPYSAEQEMTGNEKPTNADGRRELKIFLEFWLLIGLLAGFNLYNYYRNGAKMFLVVGIICVAAFIGWALFYLLYVRKARS